MGGFTISGKNFDSDQALDRLTIEEDGKATLDLNLDQESGTIGSTKTFTISGLASDAKITAVEANANNIKITTSDGGIYEIEQTAFNAKYTIDMPVKARYFGTATQSSVQVPTRGRSSGSSGYDSGGVNFGSKGEAGGIVKRTSDVLITIPLGGGQKKYLHGVITNDESITQSSSFVAIPNHTLELTPDGAKKQSMPIYVRRFDLDDFEALAESAAAQNLKPDFKIENHDESSLIMPAGYVFEATRQFETLLIPKIRYAYSQYLTKIRDRNRVTIDIKIHFKDDGSCYVTFENKVDERLKGAVHDAAASLRYPQLAREVPIHYKFNLLPPERDL